MAIASRFLAATAALALVLAGLTVVAPTSAFAAERDQDKLAALLIGGVIGAIAALAIADAIDDDDESPQSP